MSMEISAKDKKLLVYLLAIGILAAAYFFVAKPFMDKVDNISSEASQLQGDVNKLLSIYNNQENYTTKIAEEQVRFNEALQKFPSELTQESTLMMLDDIEKNTGAWISRVSFTEEEVVAGASDSSDDNLEADIASVENPEYSTADYNEVIDNAIPSGNMLSIQQNLQLDYSCSYNDFKKFLEYVENYKDRLYISSINSVYSADANEVSGSLVLTQYAVRGTGKEYIAPDLSDVNLGTDNIFTTLSGTHMFSDDAVEVQTLENPDAEYISMTIDPADIQENMLTIGKSGDVSGESYVKSSDNDVAIVKITVDGSDGNYTVTNNISGSEKSFDISTEGNILLKITSSDRNGDDDKVSVDLSVENNSDKKMDIEITTDDSDNPRVNLKEKIGNIEIK